MLDVLELASILCVAIVMALSLAHALELPGKLRLGRDEYLATQTIYYPGFTWAGTTEPLSILLLLIWLALLPPGSSDFGLVAAALFALLIVQLVFWTQTQPVNRRWLEATKMGGAGKAFFGSPRSDEPRPDWTILRRRWERSHLIRAVAAMAAFLCLLATVVF